MKPEDLSTIHLPWHTRLWLLLHITWYRSDLGDYMTRWVLRLPGGWMIRVHHIRRPDADQDLHDHPFDFVSIVLRGSYIEEVPDLLVPPDERNRTIAGTIARIRRIGSLRTPGSVAFRGCAPHRIVDVSPGGAWTLVLTTPIRRMWGFWTVDGWVPYREYLART